MSQYQRVFRILGPFIGFALLYFVITNGMDFLQRGQIEAVAEQAAAETMTGTEGITTTEVAMVTGTTDAADTSTAVTATDVAASTAITETAAVAAGASEAVTETAAAATQAVTATAAVAAGAEAITETAAAATQAVTATAGAVAAEVTEAVTATVATATSAVTSTQAATVTAPAPAATEAPAPAATEAAAPAADTSAFLKPDGSASDAVVAAITKGGCMACHTIAGVPNAMGQVGPNLNNIGVDAATREPGVSADQYIHESLMDPNKFIAPECPFGACVPGTMPQNVAQLLTPEEVELVVQFLLTRKADS